MKITKLGHCCLIIETEGKKILTDPGVFTAGATATLQDIDVVLISHEHADHFHVGSLKEVLIHNPNAEVVTNSAVGKQLDAAGIKYTVVEGRGKQSVGGVAFEAFDAKHEEIFEEVGQVQNTGYFIAEKLFYPGDSFHAHPEVSVDVLALPVAGPWCKLTDAIHFALAVKPRVAFPVHDYLLRPEVVAMMHSMPASVLAPRGVEFVAMIDGDTKEF